MVTTRIIAGLGVGAVAAASLALAPALRAQNSSARAAAPVFTGLGSFTPASADPKLAAVLARSGLGGGTGFRFTPSDTPRSSNRAVTVVVRARSTRGGVGAERVATAAPASVSLAPIAYSLGASVGWKRFAVSGDMAKVDLGLIPGSRETVDVGVSYTGKKFSGRLNAGADRPSTAAPVALTDNPSYSLDVGGSYSLTRNLDVTAGVRYKSERERLPRFTDDRRDSQAVYVGTAFRF